MLELRIRTYAVLFASLFAITIPVEAADREAARSVRAAIESYREGDFAKAQELYAEAELKCPECSEIAYNRGLASYRQRDFGAARAFFSSALQTSDLGLEAKAKYNLGNVAYSEALEKVSDLEAAIESARTAIFHYRDALELDPDDLDARTNIEMAQLLIKDLLDKQKQEREKQNQDQQNQDQQDQDQQDQDKSDQEKQDDQQKQDGDKQEGEDEQEKKEEGQQGDEKQEEEKDGQSDQDKEQLNEPQPNDEQQQAQQQEQKEASASQRKLTKEEFAQLMQAVRDKEAQRRKENKRRMRVRHAPVSKDW